MSDQGFDQQPPGAAPSQPGAPVPPQYPAPPVGPDVVPSPPPPPVVPVGFPAQPQPGAYAPPPAPQYAPPPGAPAYGPPVPPKKKSKTGLVIGVVAVVLLCAIVSCGAIGLSLYKGGSVDKNSISQAEQHLQAALSAVEKANASIQSLGSNSSASKISGVVSDTNDSLRAARDEIAGAKTIADGWKDVPGKSDYQAGLASANDALDSMQDLVAYLDTASGMIVKSKQAAKEANAGIDALNAAVHAGNTSHYSTMRSKALSASAHYVTAALLFREAHKLDKSAGLDTAARYCDLRKKQAGIIVRMASEGQTHRYSAYNSDIKRMNAASRAAVKLGAPAIVSDTSWAEKRLSALGKKITDAANKADQLRTKALKELGYTS